MTHFKRLGGALLIAGMLTVPAYANSLQAYTGVVGGTYTVCPGGGGPPTAITSFFSDLGGFGIENDPGGNGISDCGFSGAIDNLVASVGPLTSSQNVNASYGNSPGSTFNGSASATANYGTVSVGTSAMVNGTQGLNGLAETAAFGIASDTLNITGAGASGYIALDFTLNGSLEVGNPNNGGQGEMQVNVQAGSDENENIFYANLSFTSVSVTGIENIGGTLYPGEPVPGCTTGSGTFTCTNATLQTYKMPVTFTGGVPISLGLLAEAIPNENQTVSTDPPGMSLSGIQVYNASGQQVSDFTITSDSGAVYGADGIESEPVSGTPEPSTALTLALGLILIGFGARRINKSGRHVPLE